MLTRSRSKLQQQAMPNPPPNPTTTNPTCSFCKEGDHQINNCSSIELENLDKEAQFIAIFSIMVMNEPYLIKKWLTSLTTKEKTALYYRNSDPTNQNKTRTQVDYLTNIYYNHEHSNDALMMLYDKIPDKKIQKYAHIIITDFPQKKDEIKNLLEHYRPFQRKFKIKCTILQEQEQDQQQEECAICFENTASTNMLTTGCNHDFCVSCIAKYFKYLSKKSNKEHPSCALCRKPIQNLIMETKENYDYITNRFTEPEEEEQNQQQQEQQQEQQQYNRRPISLNEAIATRNLVIILQYFIGI